MAPVPHFMKYLVTAKYFLVKLCCVFVGFACISCAKQPDAFQSFLEARPAAFSLLIKNGEVIDGTGSSPVQADILVNGDTIVFVGKVDTTQITVGQTLDATGKIVSPGFIDTHAHGEPLETPAFENFLAMGVTTIFLGKDGGSPAVEDIGAWMQKVDDTIPGVNIGMFVGHGTLRMMTKVNYHQRPTDEMLGRMGALLQKQLDAGCFGMTTGLEYIPGMYAPAYELEYLAKILGENHKLITSHVRNEDDDALEASLKELLAQGKYCQVHVSHLKSVFGKGADRAKEILEIIEQARQDSISVTADVYPYTASFTGIGIVFPDWARAPNNYQEVVRTRRKELADFLREKVNQRNGPAATLLGTQPFAGKTLAEIATEKNKHFEDVLIDDIGPTGASGAYFVMDDTLQETFLKSPFVMVCSDGSPTMRHPRGYGSFAKIIETYVEEKKLFSLEEAIRKMTYLSAQTMHLPDRGHLAAGKRADILVFDPKRVKATATYEAPHQLADGFDYVIVNGKMARVKGKMNEQRYGKVLRAGQDK